MREKYQPSHEEISSEDRSLAMFLKNLLLKLVPGRKKTEEKENNPVSIFEMYDLNEEEASTMRQVLNSAARRSLEQGTPESIVMGLKIMDLKD